MKKQTILILLLTIMPYCIVSGQIAIRESNVIEKAVLRPEKFDSLENIRSLERGKGHNALKYLEQEVFFIPISKDVTDKEADLKKEIDDVQKQLDEMKSTEQAYLDTLNALSKKGNHSFGSVLGIGSKREAKKQSLQSKYYSALSERSSFENQLERLQKGYKPYSPYSPGLRQGFYKCDSIGNATGRLTYADVQNKYYIIIDLLKGSVSADGTGKFSKPNSYDLGMAFLLKERETNETILWYFYNSTERLNVQDGFGYLIDGNDIHPYFALLSSYFIKAKTIYENQVFFATNNIKNLVDINTGEVVNITKGSKWTCRELTLIPLKNGSLLVPFYVMENQAGETVKLHLSDRIENTEYLLDDFITEKRHLYLEQQKQMLEEQRQLREEQRLAEEKASRERSLKARAEFEQTCIQKYGQKLGTLIANGKVTIGMTKEMCKLAWGSPYRNNRTIVAGVTHEQWVYGWHHYLYFDNGVLTAIQD